MVIWLECKRVISTRVYFLFYVCLTVKVIYMFCLVALRNHGIKRKNMENEIYEDFFFLLN